MFSFFILFILRFYEMFAPFRFVRTPTFSAFCGLLHLLSHEQSCQEHKYICLKQTVEDVKIKTYRNRYDQRYEKFQKFQHHKPASMFPKSRIQSDSGRITISSIMIGATTGTGWAKCFYPMFHSVFPDSRKFDQGTYS